MCRLLREAESKHSATQTSLKEDAQEIVEMIKSTREQQHFLKSELGVLMRQQKIELTGLGKALGS